MCIQFALFAFFYFPEFFACFCMSLPGWLRVPLSYSFPVDHEDTSLKKRIHWAQQKCVRRNSTCTSPTSFVASHCLHNLHILHICLANLRKKCLKKSQIWKKHLLMVHTSCYKRDFQRFQVLHACHGGQEKRHPYWQGQRPTCWKRDELHISPFHV